MARRRVLVRIEVRMRTGGRVQPVAGGPREFRGRALRRAVPQYPIDATDRWRCRVAADPWKTAGNDVAVNVNREDIARYVDTNMGKTSLQMGAEFFATSLML